MTCLCWKTKQETSVYSNRSGDMAVFVSLSYIKKGAIIDSEGTPHEIFELLEYLFSMVNKNVGSVNYEWNQLTVSSQKPTAFNISNSILWSKVANPIWRFISVIPVKRPLLKPFKILSFKYERHKSVKWLVWLITELIYVLNVKLGYIFWSSLWFHGKLTYFAHRFRQSDSTIL